MATDLNMKHYRNLKEWLHAGHKTQQEAKEHIRATLARDGEDHDLDRVLDVYSRVNHPGNVFRARNG